MILHKHTETQNNEESRKYMDQYTITLGVITKGKKDTKFSLKLSFISAFFFQRNYNIFVTKAID